MYALLRRSFPRPEGMRQSLSKLQRQRCRPQAEQCVLLTALYGLAVAWIAVPPLANIASCVSMVTDALLRSRISVATHCSL
jgi:hypothetical protein